MSCRCSHYNHKEYEEGTQGSNDADNHLYAPSPVPNKNSEEDKDNPDNTE